MAIIEQKNDQAGRWPIEKKVIYANGQMMELVVRKVSEGETGNIYEIHSVKEVESRRGV